MKRVSILLGAGLVLLAAASLPIVKEGAQQTAVTEDNLNQMITSAKTPADHEAIAVYYDTEAAKARIAIAGAVETVSGPLILPNTGQEHRVTVRLPEGREYLEMEVAQAMVLKGTGAIRFEHCNTHSSMAEVTYTNEVGLR